MRIDRKKTYAFHNNVDYCVGTGRMGLALTKEYQDELRVVQEEIGFKHIRGHGLFCEAMGIYEEINWRGETSFYPVRSLWSSSNPWRNLFPTICLRII